MLIIPHSHYYRVQGLPKYYPMNQGKDSGRRLSEAGALGLQSPLSRQDMGFRVEDFGSEDLGFRVLGYSPP